MIRRSGRKPARRDCTRCDTEFYMNDVHPCRVANLQPAWAGLLGAKVARLIRALQHLEGQSRVGDQPLDEGIAQGGGGGPEAAAKL